MSTSTYLASKPRYEILDGLRGVAALIVVAFHLFENYSPGPVYQILNHGYLAVDFFFALSGFVIGYAYDDRWNRMTLWDFAKRRLVRLHPMVVLGIVIGILLFFFTGNNNHPLVEQTPWWMVLLLSLWAFLMLPAPTSWDIRGWGEMNCLNAATWSLMLEYAANILYALFIRHFPKWLLAAFVALSAGLTLALCFNWDILGVLAIREYAAYTVIGGFCLTPDQILIGFTRLLYPFFAGLLLSRIGKFITLRGAFWWCSLMVTAILVMPRIGGEEAMWMNGMYEAVSILVLFPLIVAIGAGSRITDPRSINVCKFLGDISYPLYITHYPLICFHMRWVHNHPNAPLSTHIFVAVSLFIIALGIAYASLKLYDEPVREWLKNRFLIKKK